MLKVLTVGTLAAGAILASTAGVAAEPAERITAYDVAVTVAADGNAHVTETITYDFGSNQRHGITRKVTGKKVVGKATAASPDGAPVEVTTTGSLIRVGDPGTTIAGTRTYVLDYDVAVAAQRKGADASMLWHVVDGSWNVPIASVTAAITTPAAPTVNSCTVSGTTPCASPATTSGNVIRARHENLIPRDTVLVVAKFSAASMTLPTTPPSPPPYTRPLSSAPAATTTASTASTASYSSDDSSAFGWVFGLCMAGLLTAFVVLASQGKGKGGSGSDSGYQSYVDTSSSSDSGGSSSSDSGGSSGSSDSGGGSGSW